ncbi:pyruvate, phosphate dikinase [Methanohalobium sp.]|uniref:pyruvate, phosphate dikinase n=1 Tax=Methanohalobium sp. TaxID=2837493 RepID=UPI0025FFC646|nr:pyruvate, phosphate dikinase [Methanohalobium sp.]
MTDKKFVYFFGDNQTEGSNKMKHLLGGKGANLAEMANLGVPVPPGFTISTEACVLYMKNNDYPEGMWDEIDKNIDKLEESTGKKFGDPENPLLSSVRSGAPISMPGMMDTVLNLGLNDKTVRGLAKRTDNEWFAYDSYRRFIMMFSDVVLGIDTDEFENIIQQKKDELGVTEDTELGTNTMKDLVEEFKSVYKEKTSSDFPQKIKQQLKMAINAVFNSWNNERAKKYRQLNDISDELGTAVNVQAMVFGNMGETSGTGVAFTRNPATGEKEFYGEYLTNAQGEDVVAGIRTPKSVQTLKDNMPDVYRQLDDITQKLEQHYKDMQDIEFTIEKGKLYMLQTRNAKRTAAAALKVAVDMVHENLINKNEAVMRLKPSQIDQVLHPMIDPNSELELLSSGLAASPGAAVGKVVFSAEHAEEMAQNNEEVILVRTETSPEDIGGMHAAKGVLTVRGGMTSHAAVVARGMGKPCVCGCDGINIDMNEGVFTAKGYTINEGECISIDGSEGKIYMGEAELKMPNVSGELETMLQWADDIRSLNVRTNADTPEDAKLARDFGAEGIGLCRTEHMFFGEERIPVVREMIMADNKEDREKALQKLQPMQKDDFLDIFRAMDGYPITVRLLDPPLHEFLPNYEDLIEKIKKLESEGGKQEEINRVNDLLKNVDALKETNPMLGHRGCRLGITYPEIYEMQTKAIIEAACELASEGTDVIPEIMIPLVSNEKELDFVKKTVTDTAESVMNEKGTNIDYLCGTMIELPRAALTADKIAKGAEFFSFGTNDLTQTAFGYSRDDAGKFLPLYIDKGILESDPFAVLDQEGVGELMKIGIDKGRSSRPDIKMGICGEHGGDPESISFSYEAGLNYVSCSPYRVPIARLASAQAVLKEEK